MESVRIKLGGDYDVHIGSGLTSGDLLLETLKPLGNRFAIISDSRVVGLYGHQLCARLKNEGLNSTLFEFPEGEASKTRETKARIEDEMLAAGFGRDSCVIGLGGGVTTDMAGFIAATYCRGVPAIYLPTSTLAMVDAAIGGKTGVNTAHGKNLIGVIKHPAAVFIDTDTLHSLDDREHAGGVIEAIKHTLITDRDEFQRITEQAKDILARKPSVMVAVLKRSSEIKRDVVESDEHENGRRELLNLGHTLAHAIENKSNYKISHGAAVALGILGEAKMAEENRTLKEGAVTEIKAALAPYLPLLDTDLSALSADELVDAMTLDKKSLNSTARFVLLKDIGTPLCETDRPAVTLPAATVRAGVDYILDEFS